MIEPPIQPMEHWLEIDQSGRVIRALRTNRLVEERHPRLIEVDEETYRMIVRDKIPLRRVGDSWLPDIPVARDAALDSLQRLADRAANAPLPRSEVERFQQSMRWAEAQTFSAHGTAGAFLERAAEGRTVAEAAEESLGEIRAFNAHLDAVNAVLASVRQKIIAASTHAEIEQIMASIEWPHA